MAAGGPQVVVSAKSTMFTYIRNGHSSHLAYMNGVCVRRCLVYTRILEDTIIFPCIVYIRVHVVPDHIMRKQYCVRCILVNDSCYVC